MPTAATCGWDTECADWLAQQLQVSRPEAATWLDRATATSGRGIFGKGLAHRLGRSRLTLAADVQPIITALSAGGFSAAHLVAILNKLPGVLAHPVDEVSASLHYLSQQLGLSGLQIARLPALLTISEETLRQRAANLRNSLQLSDAELRKMIVRQPGLATSHSETMKSKLDWWRSQLKSDAAARDLLLANSGLLTHSTATLGGRIADIAAAIGCSEARVLKMACQQTTLLQLTLDNIGETLAWMRAQGWDAEQVAHIATGCPRLLTLTPALLQQKLDWLANVLGLDGALAIVWASPPLMGLDFESDTQAPKWRFLVEVIGRSRASLAQSPSYLNRNLPNRIAPRTFMMLALGRPLTPSLCHLFDGPAAWLRRIGMSEEQWDAWVAEVWLPSAEGQTWSVKPLGVPKPALAAADLSAAAAAAIAAMEAARNKKRR